MSVRVARAQVALSGERARRLAGTGVAFHARRPGWVDTPGGAAALPGFYRVTRPVLLSPRQGADTIAWLATAPAALLGSGRFWHDRRPRPEYVLRWTRAKDPGAARRLWDHLATVTATDSSGWRGQGGLAGSPDRAPVGPGGVAAKQDIPPGGGDD